jgi:hypothetical protein
MTKAAPEFLTQSLSACGAASASCAQTRTDAMRSAEKIETSAMLLCAVVYCFINNYFIIF